MMEFLSQIDATLPVQERIQAFLRTTENPYHVQVGTMHVELRYRSDGPSLQQKMTQICQQS